MSQDNRPLADYVTLEHLLLGDLREILEDPITDESRGWLLVILDQLLETLHHEFTLEEKGGYMSEVLEQHPNWSRHADQLLRQHQELYGTLLMLRRRFSEGQSADDSIATARHQLRNWMMSLAAHERHERRLLQDSFSLDIGVED